MTSEATSQSTRDADILVEALPYIQRFHGMTIVIKYGGHAMVDPQLRDDFARDVTLLKFIGMNPVVVHGGGPQINLVLDQMGIRPKFVRGMRMTDAPTMDVVEMVLGGKVNKGIVAQINRQGGRAVGLSGKDGGLIEARKMRIVHQADAGSPPEIIDPGMVGEVTRINPEIIHTLSGQGFIPIIAPVGAGSCGETFNINADVVAGKVAEVLQADREFARAVAESGIEAWVEGSDLVLTMTVYGVFAPSVEQTLPGMTNRYYYHWLLDTDLNDEMTVKVYKVESANASVVASALTASLNASSRGRAAARQISTFGSRLSEPLTPEELRALSGDPG